jgi:hypothetical protein
MQSLSGSNSPAFASSTIFMDTISVIGSSARKPGERPPALLRCVRVLRRISRMAWSHPWHIRTSACRKARVPVNPPASKAATGAAIRGALRSGGTAFARPSLRLARPGNPEPSCAAMGKRRQSSAAAARNQQIVAAAPEPEIRSGECVVNPDRTRGSVRSGPTHASPRLMPVSPAKGLKSNCTPRSTMRLRRWSTQLGISRRHWAVE